MTWSSISIFEVTAFFGPGETRVAKENLYTKREQSSNVKNFIWIFWPFFEPSTFFGFLEIEKIFSLFWELLINADSLQFGRKMDNFLEKIEPTYQKTLIFVKKNPVFWY